MVPGHPEAKEAAERMLGEAQSLHAAARETLVEAFDEGHRFVADADAHVVSIARAD